MADWAHTDQHAAEHQPNPGAWASTDDHAPKGPTLQDHLKNEGFLDSAWNALKGTVGTVKDMFTGEYSHQTGEMIKRYHELEKSGTPEERRQFAKEGLLQSIPFASTAYKMLNGNVTGGLGDIAGMSVIPIAAEGVGAVRGAAGKVAEIARTDTVRGAVRDAAADIGGEALREIPGVKTGIKVVKNAAKGKSVIDAALAEIEARKAAAQPQPPAPPPPPPPSDYTNSTLNPSLRSAPKPAPSPVPEPPVPQEAPIEVPQGNPIPTRAPAWEDAAAIERLKQEQAARAANPPTLAQQIQEHVAAKADPSTPVVESATQVDPVLEQPRSTFTASGETKSPQLRGAEIKGANTTAKAQRFAKAMHEKDLTSQDAADMQAGRVSDAQIGQGVPPRWGNLADYIGENEPRSSVPEIIAELRKLEAAKAKVAPIEQPAAKVKSPRDMTRAELAKQAGLPADATTEQIMKALADAMEEDQPKAAAAAKGKQ